MLIEVLTYAYTHTHSRRVVAGALGASLINTANCIYLQKFIFYTVYLHNCCSHCFHWQQQHPLATCARTHFIHKFSSHAVGGLTLTPVSKCLMRLMRLRPLANCKATNNEFINFFQSYLVTSTTFCC